jgi:oligopeptide transport system substrate-binding protein
MMIRRLITVAVFLLAVFFLWKNMKRKEAGKITREKVLVTVNESPIKGFDPINSSDVYTAREIAKVYEGLLEYHYLKRPFELVPNLAESMPTVSDDQLVYTFKLREGVTFHDNPCFPQGKGRELTAEDFVFTFKRLADPKNQSLNFWMIDDKIQGLNEWRKKYSDAATVDYSEAVAGVQAIDRYTIQFKLNRPYPQFLYALATVPCYVVAKEAVAYYGEEFTNHPVGTGPFLTEPFNSQHTKIVYYKNGNFRDKLFPNEASDAYKHMLTYADRKLPLVDKIVTNILPEEQPRWLKFQKGQLDVLDISRDNIALEIIQNNSLIPSLQDKEVQLFRVGETSTSYVVFNLSYELFRNNLKLRQAMSLAFDAAEYNKLFYNGGAILAQSTIAPGLPGYQPDYRNPYRMFNLEKAKQYLADAGYAGGKGLPEFTLDIGHTTAERQKGELFQKFMRKIGINIKVVPNIFPELIKKINNKSTILHAISWAADYPDAETFLQLLYTHAEGGIGVNFDDPVYNALYEKATSIPDSSEKTQLYEQLNQIAAEKVPCIYIVHPRHNILQQGWLKNYTWSDFHFGTEQYWDIDLEKKQALLGKL